MSNLRTLRSDLERVIESIQLRRANAREMVQKLIYEKAAMPVAQEPVTLFQNANAQSFMFTVATAFQVATVRYREGNAVVARRTADGQIELENRATGSRAIMDMTVWEKVRQNHLAEQWPEGDWGF